LDPLLSAFLALLACTVTKTGWSIQQVLVCPDIIVELVASTTLETCHMGMEVVEYVQQVTIALLKQEIQSLAHLERTILALDNLLSLHVLLAPLECTVVIRNFHPQQRVAMRVIIARAGHTWHPLMTL
jgi:hypothetical protein